MNLPAARTPLEPVSQVLRPLLDRKVPVREFFRHHGIWSPGVRLLRRWSFRHKLLLLMTVLALPLTWLVGNLAQSFVEDIQQLDQRLAGAEVANAAYALAAPMRREAASGASGEAGSKAELETAFAALVVAVERALEAGVDIERVWEARKPVLSPKGVDTGVDAEADRSDQLRRRLSALTALHLQAVDSSGLLLNPDRHSKLLASSSFNHLPRLQADLLKSSRQLKELVRAEAAGAVLDGQPLRAAVVKLAASNESARRSLIRIDENAAEIGPHAGSQGVALAAVDGFIKKLDTWLLDPALVADAAALAQSADAAMAGAQSARLSLSATLVERLRQEQAVARHHLLWTGVAIVLLLLLSAYIAVSMQLVMRGGLDALDRSMTKMANGDLSGPIAAHGSDEIGVTLQSLERATGGLSELLASVREGVAAFRQASVSVAEGNNELSGRSRAMAERLEALVSGIGGYTEQLGACGRQVEAVVLSVQKLRLEAARNRKHVAHLNERMQALLSKTREIGQIVTLIDGISFRTNILALNASVEAAKAGGELGRGFAVVAQEVRSLARRAAGSAQRIGDIVSRSNEDFEFASALVTETGQALAAADEHVDQIHGAMSEVSALTQAGAQQAGEMLQGLNGLQEGTGKNLQLVDQLATASGALRTQGERLAHKVGRFRLS